MRVDFEHYENTGTPMFLTKIVLDEFNPTIWIKDSLHSKI